MLYYYIGLGYVVVSLIILVLLMLDRVKRQTKFDIHMAELLQLAEQNQSFTQERVELIKRVEQLSEKVRYQDDLIKESQQLKQQSNDATKAALFELGNKLSSQLIDLHKKENHETRKLSEKNIESTVLKFNSEFERISNMVSALNKQVVRSQDTVETIKNSLLSPSGAGALAEITLENILKASGLRRNIDFVLQYSVNEENENAVLRPDAVVFLPGDRLMVIDSKASKFLMDPEGSTAQLARSMNMHLRSLASKNYADSVKKYAKLKNRQLSSTITLMFLPTEHSVEKIMEADNGFLDRAWNLNIFPVGPSGIMNMLSFAKFQISEKQVNENNMKIIEEVQKLLSSISSMTDHATKLGNSISSAVNHYDKFAASFNRNFLGKAKKIGSMGVENSLKKDQEALKRLQLFTSKSELIEIEAEPTKAISDE